MTMASKLGSDVPFLLKGGTARGTDRGELLETLPTSSAQWLLIVKPEVSISTAEAYGRFTGTSRVTSATMDTVTTHMKAKDFRQAFITSDNTFEELIFPVHPELVICKQFFLDRGFPTIMTGSGPTMVVLLEKALDAIRLQEEIKQAGHNWLSLITKTHDEEALR